MPRTTSRTWYALMLAATLLAGAAAAQDAASETPATPDEPSFRLKAAPGELWLKPGARETIRLHAAAGEPTMLKLSAEAPRGVHVALGNGTMGAGPEGASVPVVLGASEGTPRGDYAVRFAATSRSGETQATRVLVHVAGETPVPRPHEERPGFALKVEPASQRTRGDERLTFTLVAHAARNATFQLSMAHLPRGYEASLSPETLSLKAGERAKATLIVHVPGGAESGTLVVQAKSLEGNAAASAKAHVEVVPRERPVDEPSVTDEERYPPAREARPAAGPGFRMHLFPADALVGPEGGRAVLLLQGGGEDQLIKLGVRHDPSAGWRVHVRDAVRLPAHGTAWAWVVLQPGEDNHPLKYDLYASGARGSLVASGMAQVEERPTA